MSGSSTAVARAFATVAFATVALATLAPRAAAAGPLSADAHREAGYAHVQRGAWDDAVREYQAAYAIDQDPVSLYAIGRVEVQRGDCAAAIDAFRRFLATGPAPKARASAEAEVARCEATLAAAAPPPEPEPEPEVAPPPPPPAPVRRRRHRPFYADALGGVLVGGGAVASGLGAYFYVQARGELCDDPCTGSYQSYQDHMARARTWRNGALIAGGVGAGLIVAGAVRWIVHREPVDRDDVDVAWSPRPGGGALIVGGRF